MKQKYIKSELGNLLELVVDYRGKTPKKLNGVWESTGTPALSAKNIKKGRIVNEEAIRYVNDELYHKWMHTDLRAGDILMTSEAPLGETYLVKENEKYLLSQRLFALRANPKKINPTYLYYYLNTAEGQNELMSRATGTTVGGIRQSALNNVVVKHPESLEYQNRISQIISKYDELFINNEKRMKLLEETAKSIYVEWFVNYKFPSTIEINLVNSNTELGYMPFGWEVSELSEVAQINPSTKISKSENITFVPMECLSNTHGYIDLTKIVYKSKVTGSKFKNSDVLFARITPCMENGKNCLVSFLSDTESACGSTEFIVIRSKILTPIYLYFLTRTPAFRNAAKLTMVGASGRQRVHSAFFKNYLVAVPPSILLSSFESRVSSIFKEINTLNKLNFTLLRMKDLLLPQLITGGGEVNI